MLVVISNSKYYLRNQVLLVFCGDIFIKYPITYQLQVSFT